MAILSVIVEFHSPQFLSILSHFLLLQARVPHQSHALDYGLSEAEQRTSPKAAFESVTLQKRSYLKFFATPGAASSIIASTKYTRPHSWSSMSGLSQAESGYGSTMSDPRLVLTTTNYTVTSLVYYYSYGIAT